MLVAGEKRWLVGERDVLGDPSDWQVLEIRPDAVRVLDLTSGRVEDVLFPPDERP